MPGLDELHTMLELRLGGFVAALVDDPGRVGKVLGGSAGLPTAGELWISLFWNTDRLPSGLPGFWISKANTLEGLEDCARQFLPVYLIKIQADMVHSRRR